MDYTIVNATPEEWLEEYRKFCDTDDIALAQDGDGYYFTTADGKYNTDDDANLPDYILDQPWSVLQEELDNGAIEPKKTYYKIDESGRLYEAPWEA